VAKIGARHLDHVDVLGNIGQVPVIQRNTLVVRKEQDVVLLVGARATAAQREQQMPNS
jgi:hypothetical protein